VGFAFHEIPFKNCTSSRVVLNKIQTWGVGGHPLNSSLVAISVPKMTAAT